jgi:hypothetical protein
MTIQTRSILGSPPPSTGADCERVRARWSRLCADFARLPRLDRQSNRAFDPRDPDVMLEACVRDVGELLLLGHDDALADAERYVAEGHTMRTGQVVEFDDIDDDDALRRWADELERASAHGWAPPAPRGFWASFLRWRTPLGMARLTDRRSRPRFD